MSEENLNQNDIGKRLIEIEAKLLEQEHRPHKLVWNFWNRKKYKKVNDKRRKAVSKALLFRILFSPTTIAIAGTGIISYFTIYFMFRQTELFESQNKLFQSQNKLFQSQNNNLEIQTQLIEASRRSSQMFIMSEVLSDINREIENSKNTKKTLSNGLTGRVIALSKAMKPYRYLENDTLIHYPISPERGQLLIALLESGINKEFLCDRILSKSDFSNSDLINVTLKNVHLNNIFLDGSNLKNAKFVNVQMNNANLNNTSLLGSTFWNVSLKKSRFIGSKFDFKTKIIQTNLEEVASLPIDFLFSSFQYYNTNIKIVEDIRAPMQEIQKIAEKNVFDRMRIFKENHPEFDYTITPTISGDDIDAQGIFIIKLTEIK